MSDLGSQPREVWKQPGRLPAEERLGSSESTSSCLFFVACLALSAYVSLVWHSEPSILYLIRLHAQVEMGVIRLFMDILTVLSRRAAGRE
jgi:hypothetical protein